jgi:hypothetical protein
MEIIIGHTGNYNVIMDEKELTFCSVRSLLTMF